MKRWYKETKNTEENVQKNAKNTRENIVRNKENTEENVTKEISQNFLQRKNE